MDETPHRLINQNSKNILNTFQQQLVLKSPHSATNTIPPNLSNEHLSNATESNLSSKKSTDSINLQDTFNYPQVIFFLKIKFF